MNRLRPSAVAVAVWLALTLGIALNTTMFSTVEGFLLRPLPVSDIDSVVRVREVARGEGAEQVFSMSPQSFLAWREHNRVFDGMAAATGQALTLTGTGEPIRLQGAQTSANFFELLGVRPALGRTFVQGEDGGGRNAVAVIAHQLWQRQFGGNPDIVGRAVLLDGRPHTVVGVMPRSFSHPYEADIWTPLDFDALVSAPSGNFLYVPARLREGIELVSAQAELDRMAELLHAEMPELGPANASRLTPLRDEVLGTLRPVLFVLLGGSVLVLLLAVINVGTLLLARSVSERALTSIRIALGARTGHLLRRALSRNGAVAVAAWLAGLAVCMVTLEPMLGLAGASAINEFDAAPRVNFATAGYALAIALAIALALAVIEGRAARMTGAVRVGREKAGSMPPGMRRMLGALVSVQFALSFALVGATVLVAAGYAELVAGELGYEPEGLIVSEVAFPLDRYPDTASRALFIQRALDELRATPGVMAAGVSTVTPDYQGSWAGGFVVPGHEPPQVPGYDLTQHRIASAGYLAALGVPLLVGRDFDGSNLARDAGSVIISRDFAEQYWGTPERALGSTLTRIARWGRVELTVVGVVGDVTEANQAAAAAMPRAWYLPLGMGTEYDFSAVSFVVRGTPAVAGALREVVGRLDHDLALHRTAPITERLATAYSRERWSRFMFGLFGLTACAIAAVGLYSALNFITALRRREFGIRLALGASSRAIARGVIAQALIVGLVGIVAGVPLLLAALVLLESYFAGVNAASVEGVVAMAFALCILAILAALQPAYRASRVAPMQALRDE